MAKKKSSQPLKKQPGWLNKTQMAASIGISTQAFDKWKVPSVGKIGRETFYTVGDVLANREQKLIANDAGNNNPDAIIDQQQMDYERWRKTKAEADRLELQNEVTRKNQAPVVLLEWALASLASQVGSVLDAIPNKIKKRMPNLKATELALIENEITRARNSAAGVGLPWDELEESD